MRIAASVTMRHQLELSGNVRPSESAAYQVEVRDNRGSRQVATTQVLVGEGEGEPKPPEPPKPEPLPDLHAEGPLQQALTELWEKARKAGYKAISRLSIRMFEAPGAWKVYQSVAVLQGIKVSCHLEAEMTSEGVECFRVEFAGKIDKASSVKSFLEPILRAAADANFEAGFVLAFDKQMSLEGEKPETLARKLTKSGGGEAYVEAQALRSELESI